jgi:hypothetical protein
MCAVREGHLEVVKVLVQAGADKEKLSKVSSVMLQNAIVLSSSKCTLTGDD